MLCTLAQVALPFCFCWPGCAPGGAVPFIWRQMKGTKAKAPLLPASLRLRLRATCGARSWAAPHNSLRAARSVQTDAVSQFTWQLHSSMQLLSPRPALLGACKRGGGPKYQIASLWASAAHDANALPLLYEFDSCWRAPDKRQRLKTPKADSIKHLQCGVTQITIK